MEIKRKSVKKKKIKVEYIKIKDCNCLLFTLEKPYFQLIIGASKILSFCEIDDISQKVCSIFYNSTREYVYCLEEDIKNEIIKIEEIYLKG